MSDENSAAGDRPQIRDHQVAVIDPARLRALAHPIRLRLLGLLRRYGPSTATRLGERMDVSSGTASYHLRQLGQAGLTEEDSSRGNARERWWRSVHEFSTLTSEADVFESEPEAADAYLHAVTSIYSYRLEQAVAQRADLAPEWQQVFDLSDYAFRLTPEEATRLRADLRAVVSRYRWDVAGQREQAPPGAARVSLVAGVLPEPATSLLDGDGRGETEADGAPGQPTERGAGAGPTADAERGTDERTADAEQGTDTGHHAAGTTDGSRDEADGDAR